MLYDIAVIGAGIAGMTAAIYARRAGKSVVIFEKESIGGQISLSPKAYPCLQHPNTSLYRKQNQADIEF